MSKIVRLLAIALIMLAATALAFAGGQGESKAAAGKPAASSSAATGARYHEAPSLAALVKEGKLPPVEQRLPEEPMVVKVQEVGTYGGDLQYPATYEYALNVWIRTGLVEFAFGKAEPGPGLAKSWEASPDGTEFTFFLRKGLKWSDGEPYTTKDIMFWWQDIINNKTLTPVVPSWLKSGGDTQVIAKDDYTITFKFAAPYALFPKVMAFRSSYQLENTAMHYLKQFHPKYRDKAELDALTKKEGFETWDQLFGAKRDELKNVDLPTMDAWKLVQPWPDQRMILVRNPYYYKVDTAGNQLPYIDRVVSPFVADAETARLKVLDGQTDFQYKFMGFGDFTMLKEGEAAGGYRVLKWAYGESGVDLDINQYLLKDPEKRKLLQNKDFRYALSYGIDRDTMNKLLMFGVGLKYQPVCAPLDPYYEKGMGQNALVYDTDKANKMLDALGLDKRDKDGYRLLPSGKRLELTIETFPFEIGTAAIKFYDLVAQGWTKNLGIKTVAKQESAELWEQRVITGEVDIAGYDVNELLWDLSPGEYVPLAVDTYWAPLYGLWYATGGKDGQEPPPEIKNLMDWWDQLKAEVDPQKRLELGRKIMRAHDENLWMINILKAPFQPVVVNKRLHNVLENGSLSWMLGHEGQTWQEQLWYTDGKRK